MLDPHFASNAGYQQTRRDTQRPRLIQVWRHTQRTLKTGELVAAASPMTLPLAGAANSCDVPIKPIPTVIKTARTIIFIATSCAMPPVWPFTGNGTRLLR
jgi:hypothetical protein